MFKQVENAVGYPINLYW